MQDRRYHWVKLYTCLMDEDDRFLFQLTDQQQLLFVKLLMLAGITKNKIPANLEFIKHKTNYRNSIVELELELLTIQKVFPGFQKDPNSYFFTNFISAHNFSIGKDLQPLNDIREDKIRERDREDTPKQAVDIAEAFDYWNLKNPSKHLRYLSDKRKKKLRARWQEEAWRDSWRVAIEKLAASTFCNGQNDRGWQASFDWLIENDNNYVKVLEGRYDNRTAPASQPFRQSL